MRRFYVLLVMCLLSVATFAQMLPDNWTIGSSAISVTQESTTVSDGAYSMSVVWTSTSNQDIDSDPFTVVESANYSLTVDAFDNDLAGRVRIAIIWSNGTNDYFGYSSDDPDWQLLTQTGTVPTGATEAFVRLRFYDVSGDWDGDANVILDNVVYSEDGGANLVTNFSFEDWSEPSYPEYTIYEIQGQLDASPYLGDMVQTTGIVTGAFSSGYFIQDGTGAWNGIYIFDNTNTPAIGDEITVIGEVGEYFDKTQLASISSFTVNSSGNVLPDATLLSTADVNDEMYEGVLVKINNAVCTSEPDSNNEWVANDGSGEVIINDLIYDASPELYGIYNITGIVDYGYGAYKIEPRNSTDVEYLGSELDNALTDAANNTTMTITPETQTIDEGVDAVINANVVYPTTIDAILADYYMDAVIDFGTALPNDVDVTITYSQNGSTPNELGTFTITETTTEAYLSEIIGSARTLLSGHAGLELDWGITVTGLVAGTYNINIETVTNTNTEFGTNDFVLASDDTEIIVEASVQDALTDAANNTTMTITPETQTIDEGVDAAMNANVVFPSTIDAILADYYMDAVIDFGTALPNDVDVTITYSQNGSTPNELGTFTIAETTTEAYLSEIIGSARTLLSGHAGLELDWGITVTGLVAGTYNINIETVTNTNTEFGTNDFVLASDDAEVIVEASVQDALTDAANNTTMTITPETQTIDEGVDAAMNANVVFPSTIDAMLADYYMDAVIDFGTALPNDVDVTITYSQNGSTPNELGTFTITETTTEAYLSEIIGSARTLLSGHAGLELDWGITVTGLVAGTYNINIETVTNTNTEFGTNDFVLASDDTEIIVEASVQDALTDAANNTTMTITPETQTIDEGVDAAMNANVVFPSTIDAMLADYYMDAVIDFGTALPNDVDVTITYSQNGSTPNELGTFTITETTTEAYLSEIIGSARTLLSGHAGLELDWGITVTGLVAGTYNINIETVTNTDTEFGTNDFVLASDDAEVIVEEIIPGDIVIVNQPTDAFICDGDSIEFVIEANGTEPLNFEWYLNDEIIEGEESNSIYASTDGEYYCVVFNDVDTVSTDIFTLTISIPVVEFDEDTHYCINWEATLDAGEFESYLWNTGDDTQIISADTSGTYIVEVTDIHGCVGTGEISLTFDLDWELDYPSKVTLCEGDSVTLTMPDADTWIWSTGENTQSITLDQAGTINVTVVQGNCISEAEIKIESSINPPAIDLGPDRYLCNGDEIELQSPTYASQYRWDLNGEVVSTTNKVEVIEEGLYSLTIFNSAGCSEYDEINVFYNDYLIINIGDSINSCEGQEIKLSPGEVDSLVWDNGTEVDSLIVTTNGWYYVTVVDDLGCIGQDSAYVFFNELPEISIGNDTAFCDGNELEIIAPEAELYLWNTEDSTQSIVVNESGSYTVTITDTNGCQNSDSKVLTVWDNPFIDLGPDKTITEDQTIILGAEPGHPDYAWSTGETSDFIVINGLAYGIGEHLISLTVISDNGCENYDEVLITIIEGVGISTNLTDAISIYPNPADQIINIELNKLDDFVGLEIINIEGKVIYENNKDKDLELDIENWQSGVYFVKIVTEKEIGVLKFIKN